VGQWHLKVLLPALTNMMNRLGLETIRPSFSGTGNL